MDHCDACKVTPPDDAPALVAVSNEQGVTSRICSTCLLAVVPPEPLAEALEAPPASEGEQQPTEEIEISP
jgi:hypothetical protein